MPSSALLDFLDWMCDPVEHLEAWSPCWWGLQTSVYVPVYVPVYVCAPLCLCERVCIHCETDVCQVGKLEFHFLCSAHIETLLYFAGMCPNGGLQNPQQDAAHLSPHSKSS